MCHLRNPRQAPRCGYFILRYPSAWILPKFPPLRSCTHFVTARPAVSTPLPSSHLRKVARNKWLLDERVVGPPEPPRRVHLSPYPPADLLAGLLFPPETPEAAAGSTGTAAKKKQACGASGGSEKKIYKSGVRRRISLPMTCQRHKSSAVGWGGKNDDDCVAKQVARKMRW